MRARGRGWKSLERRGIRWREFTSRESRARGGVTLGWKGARAREEDEDDEGAGWMETLERGVGGGVLVSRDSWMCVKGRRTGAPRDGNGRRGAIDRCSMTGDECSI